MPTCSESRKSLFLVNPKRKYRYHWDLKELCRIMHKRTTVHPLALPYLAALTPSHFDVRILDEEMQPLRFDPLPDIVGITALGPSIKRAYEIADRYRELGVPVVMGGAQVSFNVEETLEHADSVVIGEAEGVWAECLSDFEKGRMKPFYKRDEAYDFKTVARPRWDLVDTSNVMALGVQVSRGCPYSCEFCLVHNMFGKKQRYRDHDDVIDEIKALPKKQITFVDDNLTGSKPYALELMRRLKPLKVSWMCQSSLEVCRDDNLLRAMAEAGCTSMLLGIESLNPEGLKETGKLQNRTEQYEEGIRRIHSHGIHVIGSFIVGFDADRIDAFDHIFDFTMRNNISLIMLNVLTAYPGTDLYDRMKKAGRVTDVDPDLLNGIYPTMQYRHISQSEMFQKYFKVLEKMFSNEVVLEKALRVFDGGAFQRYNDGDISRSDKLFSMAHLILRYALSLDRGKRKLFAELLSLVFKKKAGIGNVIEFLLLISSFNGYLEFTKAHRVEVLEMIKSRDPGPVVQD